MRRRQKCGSPLPSSRSFSPATYRKPPLRGLLGINQPKISALVNYRLDGFSVERLMHFLNALDRDVEIVIRKKPRSRRAARIVVTQAQMQSAI